MGKIPGRDRDIAIARLLFGYSPILSQGEYSELVVPELGFLPLPRFDSQMTDAWKVIERLWETTGCQTVVRRGVSTRVKMIPAHGTDLAVEISDDDPARAIVRCAILLLDRH